MRARRRQIMPVNVEKGRQIISIDVENGDR
jgi:hypothetical protein